MAYLCPKSLASVCPSLRPADTLAYLYVIATQEPPNDQVTRIQMEVEPDTHPTYLGSTCGTLSVEEGLAGVEYDLYIL